MNGRGEADSTGRGRAHFTPLGSASGPCHSPPGGNCCCACWPRRAPHFLLTSAVNPAPAGWDVQKKKKKSPSRIGPDSHPSALIPDTLMGRRRRWAGAAKKIIRSFELRLLASLSATMNREII